MQKWTAFILSGALLVTFVIGLFVQPLDSQANPGTIWQASFYANTSLAGEPALIRNDRTLNFNWSLDAPSVDLPVDGFSARWKASFEFEAGQWLFSAGADDGIRLWVDDDLLIDQWESSGTFVVHTAQTALDEGEHTIKVEYYDAEGLAGISVDWKPAPKSAKAADVPDTPPQSPPAQSNPTPIPADAPLAHVAIGILNVRTGPGIDYQRIDQVYLYQRFPLLGQNPEGTWYWIDLKDGRTGWVASRYIYLTGNSAAIIVRQPPIAGDQFEGMAGTTLVRLNVRPEPNENTEVLGIIPYDVEILVLGRNSTSVWYYVSYGDELEGWVYSPYTTITGRVYDLPYLD
ncbi:MAG: SH3 domain-containing protein [Anaerolineales bacterium]|nr:SH3 domain-containing protein [Anaerolineales bacterium]